MKILTETDERSAPTILFVVNHAGFFLSHRLPLALAAAREGYHVIVATPPSKHVPIIIENELEWLPIRMRRSSTNPLTELWSIVDLIRLYRKVQPRLVHQVTNKVVLYGTLAARVAGVPAVINAISGLGHIFGSNRIRDRVILFCVSTAYGLLLRHENMRVIFQNEEQRSGFVERGWIAPDQTVLIRGSGVDSDEFRPRFDDQRRNERVVMFASRLIRSKGVTDFVEAARRLRERFEDVRFVIVGEPDPDNPASVTPDEVQEWDREPRLECWGRRNDMPDVLREADIFCLPTAYPEGVPKVLIEAASTGLPIVTTDIPGCRDIVRHRENGFTVPPNDRDALVDALAELLEDPERARVFGQKGREIVVGGGFRLTDVVASTLSLYRQMAPVVGQ